MQTTVSLTRLTASELVASIAAGDVSASGAVDAHIDRIEEIDGPLNAIVARRYDDARREAGEADAALRRGERIGRLHGVPVTIKDQFDVAGLPTTFGVSRLADQAARTDGRMVAALRAAGAIVLAKTNVPPGLGAIETDNDLFGRTNNPWDLSRTPGGSSGADAAVVAAGGVPLSLGADLGGSLRIPAAWCGVYTLVPTVRRLPIDRPPTRTGAGFEFAQAGPFARSTDDVALALRVMVEAVVERPTELNPPVAWREPHTAGVEGRRVALLTEIDGFTPSPAIRRSLGIAADALRSAGAHVEPWTSAPDPAEAITLAFRAFTADGGAWMSQLLAGEKPHALIKADVQAATWPNAAVRLLGALLAASGQHRAARAVRRMRTSSARELMDVLGDRMSYVARFVSALDDGQFDLILAPATPLPAVPHGLSTKLPDVHAPSVMFTNIGLPTGVVPVTRVEPSEESDRPSSRDAAIRAAITAEQGSAGLPVGVQVAARHWREDLVLAAMHAIESATSLRPDHPGMPSL